jgi:hypothetical protein
VAIAYATQRDATKSKGKKKWKKIPV